MREEKSEVTTTSFSYDRNRTAPVAAGRVVRLRSLPALRQTQTTVKKFVAPDEPSKLGTYVLEPRMTAAMNASSAGLVGLANFSSTTGVIGTVAIAMLTICVIMTGLLMNPAAYSWLRRKFLWLEKTGALFAYGIATYAFLAVVCFLIYFLTRAVGDGTVDLAMLGFIAVAILAGYTITCRIDWMALWAVRRIRQNEHRFSVDKRKKSLGIKT